MDYGTSVMADRIACFVMSGGVGSRLWPLSREDNPKQFHDLSGKGSMLVRTINRMRARPDGETPVFLIGSERHAQRVGSDLAAIDLGGGRAIFEPVGRNTAAAVAIAALTTLRNFGDDLVLVVPSDHEITTDADFWATVEAGTVAARAGSLVVFGIPPTVPETGYGYIEAGPAQIGLPHRGVTRFVEKPNLETAKTYLAAGNFFWNSGIFLFRASAMRDAFRALQPDIWASAETALDAASDQADGLYLPLDQYLAVPSNSIDYAVMERAGDIAMVPASFRWNDLGSWQSLLDVSPSDENGNVIFGDVVAIDTERSYLRSQGRLLSVIGLKDIAIVATADATFVAPVAQSQNVKKIVERLEKSGRLETKFTPADDRVLRPGSWRKRVQHWLFEEALPLWSTQGVDNLHGGFHEALGFDGRSLGKPKRTRTMARQIYAFAEAKALGWAGPADALISHGIDFLVAHARSPRGGWVRALNPDGSVADPVEDAYDHACVLLALAHAHEVGHAGALELGRETLAFLDEHLEDRRMTGFLENSDGAELRRSNPHMHLLETFLAWHRITGDRAHLRRAARIVELFRSCFFDPDSWTLGEFFDDDWKPAGGQQGEWTEPGHHFEWAALLVEFAHASGQNAIISYARKLYASAVANGTNRATGLAFGAVSRIGVPLDPVTRSWPQTEAIKAAAMLDGIDGRDLKPEIETRIGQLFRWHIDPAPNGLWIDRIDERGRAIATEVPASILYHITSALSRYLRKTENLG